MTITLQDFAAGDTNYVAKLNSNSDVIEAAIAGLQALTSGAAFAGATLTTAYAALFGATVALIGDDSYACSDAGGSPSGYLSVGAGYCYRPTLVSVVGKTTATALGFAGQSAATYYIVVDSTGEPTLGLSSTDAIYSVVWTGSAFGTITRLANIVWGAADWIAAQTSTGLGHTFTSLDDRLEAIETSIGAAFTAQAPHTVFAGPVAGSPTNDLPTFRAIAASDLPTMVGDSGSGGTAGAVPAPAAGDAAAGKFLKANGTFAVPAGATSGTVTSVNITQPAAGITATGGPVTASGSITLALANDLAALEGLSSTGYAKRTGTDAWSLQSTIPVTDVATFTGDDSGSPDSGVKGLVPAPAQGDAAAGKFLFADGTWKEQYLPQNSKSAAYTTVRSDAGKHLLHPSADTTARTFTIDSNANVAYPIGTAITFVNQASAGVMTIAITSDTMRLAGAGTTGSRTLAANGIATALKVTSTEWIISGTGLT